LNRPTDYFRQGQVENQPVDLSIIISSMDDFTKNYMLFGSQRN